MDRVINNLMQRNIDRCYLLVSTNTVNIKLWSFDVNNGSCEKLLVFKFDQRLLFDDQTSGLCKVYDLWKLIDREIHALARITPFMNFFIGILSTQGCMELQEKKI